MADLDVLGDTNLATTRTSEPRLSNRLPSGTTLGRYEIKDVLGSGGMGVVYRAFDPELGRLIALKVVHAERDAEPSQSNGRLVREAQAMARLANPHVIVVHDAGTVGNQVFVAMELVDGQDLASWELAAPRSWREVVNVYTQAARGLAAAHDAGLVHRDFKPANALIARDGRVRVLDFGLARSLDHDASLDPLGATRPAVTPSGRHLVMTQTGAVMGTPQFMSPEQHHGERADARTDQFSFCVALYHALYGGYPFIGKTYAELAVAVTDGEPVVPPRGSVPSGLAKVVMRGLQREPAKRFASMSELIAALDAAMPRKRWPLVAGASVVVLALAAVIVALMTRNPRSGAPIAMAFATNQQPVTEADGLVALPAWSPDGTLVVYANGTGLVVRNLTTGARVEVRDHRTMWDIRWSPAGDQFMVATDHGVVLRARDGAIVKEIPISVEFEGCHAAWSPDSAEILWHCDGDAAFLLVTIATSVTRPLRFNLDERVLDFDWSRTGIVLVSYIEDRYPLYLARADGTVIRKLADDGNRIGAVRWNTRGTRVYYQRAATRGYEIVYRSVESSGPAVVVLVQPQGLFTLDPSFAIGKDERSLIYLQQRSSQDVVQTTLPPTAPKLLTADGNHKAALALAPDQTAVAFAAGDSAGMQLFHLSLAGGAPIELDATERVDYEGMAFSPDGKQLAVLLMRAGICELWIVPVARGPKRELSVPKIRCERVDWLTSGQIAVLRDDASNLVLVDPVSNTNRPLWPTDSTDNLEMYALSVDGKQLVALVPHDEITSLTAIDVASRETRILSATSSLVPFAWSTDRAWIYSVEQPTDDPRLRIVASNLAGTGETRLVEVLGSTGRTDTVNVLGKPGVFANGTGMVWIGSKVSVELWLASIEPLPPIPRGPPLAVKPPPVAPSMHAKPTNLALVGAVGAVPDGWKASGTPTLPTLTTTCGRPGTCVTLDGESGGEIYQLIDATPYRGRRLRVQADLRVQSTTCILVVDSGIYATSEMPAGHLRVRDQAWEKREMFADVAPDAIFIELKVVLQQPGTCWVGGLELELVP